MTEDRLPDGGSSSAEGGATDALPEPVIAPEPPGQWYVGPTAAYGPPPSYGPPAALWAAAGLWNASGLYAAAGL